MNAYSSRHQGLIGTVIDIVVDADDAESARSAEDCVVERIAGLQDIFDVHRHESEVSRWRRGELEAGPELSAVLGEALDWMIRSGGAFNPAVAEIKRVWASGAETNRVPSGDELDRLVAGVANAPYLIENGAAVRLSDRAERVDLNAIAKGWIVDRAVEAGLAAGAAGVTVNAGGDIVHRSPRTMRVGIEDPRRPYDNVPPMVRVRISDEAIATSGGARRFWTIGGRRYPQVFDPRTGHPAEGVLSASVIAPDAATADAAATILTVMAPEEGVAWATGLGLGALTLDIDGGVRTTPGWDARQEPEAGSRKLEA